MEVPITHSDTPIPLYPKLAKVLGSLTMAAIVAYLEIHHPHTGNDSQASTGRSSAPFSISTPQLCGALGINRRTLHIALYSLCTFWLTEELRSSAARSGREFLSPDHTQRGKVKPFSIVGSKGYSTPQILTFRRNYGRINQILTAADIEHWPETMQQVSNIYPPESDGSATSSSLPDLPEILANAMRLRVRNGWTEERRVAQSAKMREIWEMRKKSGWRRK